MAHLLAIIALTLPAAAYGGGPGLGPSPRRIDFPVRTPTFFTLSTPTALLTNATHANHTTNSPAHVVSPTNVTFAQLDDECFRQPLTPALWHKLEMNAYLDTYPGGKEWTLEKYAIRVGATDFLCGIGKVCSPGQLCESVKGRDWYALVAAMNWNNFVNSLFEAAGDAFNEVSAILPTMLIDMEKDPTRTPRHISAWVGLASNWLSSFPSSLFASIGPIENSIWLSWGTISWIALIMTIYQISAFSWVNTLLIVGNGESRFIRSSDVTWMLGEAQHAVQETISNITQQVITAGISTPQGLASINRDGIFLSGVPLIDQNTVQKEFERSLKLKTLIKLWRLQGVFIVRGSEPCTKSGPNGAIDSPGVLSYCGSDGVMMNIVRADIKSNKFYSTLYHGELAEYKYGFSTDFLTTNSWACQKKHGVFEYDPFTNRTAISYVNPRQPDDCLVNLPVCDCTNPSIIIARRKGQSLTQACREIAGLPI